MYINFLRSNVYAAGVITILRLYVGWQWLTAGWGKITGDPFDVSGFVNGAVNNPVMSHGEMVYPTYVAFLENVVLGNAGLFSILVSWGELLVGIGLILGVLTTTAAFFALMMNFSFMFAGTVSSNPLLILLTIFIVVAGANAGRFGVDRWILPYFGERFNGKRSSQK